MTEPRIGFACLWDRNPMTTWSHTPWHLRQAMRRRADVVDAGVRLPGPIHFGLQAMHARWRAGRPITLWQQSRLTDAICQLSITRTATRAGCDAVLQIQDLARLHLPYFLYQDMSFEAQAMFREATGLGPRRDISPGALRRRQERQRLVYEGATGVLTMSHWLARTLVEQTGLPPEKVHVVHPGTSALAERRAPLPVREGPRRRLLFVGRGDFHGKGGDLAIAALAILRRELDPAITLTIVGPDDWPLPGGVPDGVDFRGRRPLDEIAELYDTHDLFVMPSRVEAFGIVFAEAAGRGLPSIGRNAWAMPELIRPGVTGALVDSDDPATLAGVIATTLADDALYAKCRAGADEVCEWFSWDRAARDAVAVITRSLRR